MDATGNIPLLRLLLTECAELLGAMVSLEFAVTWSDDRPPPARFGFLQVRPMLVSKANVHIRTEQMEGDRVLAASESALGNRRRDDIHDIVYLKVGSFDVSHTPMMAAELEEINRKLLDQGRPYLLIGFGRWGTTDPSGGRRDLLRQACAHRTAPPGRGRWHNQPGRPIQTEGGMSDCDGGPGAPRSRRIATAS